MNLFEHNWMTSKWVDFEFKKYTLLGYLQKVSGKFREQRVYPYLSVLRNEYQLLLSLKEATKSHLPNDLQRMLSGESLDQTISEEMKTVHQLVRFALPRMNETLAQGDELIEKVKTVIRFEPVGLLPCNRREGYVIFRHQSLARTYRYALRNVAPGNDNEIHTSHLKTWFLREDVTSAFRPAADIKYELLRTHRDLPNPAVFEVSYNLSLPYPETLVPVCRTMLYEAIRS